MKYYIEFSPRNSGKTSRLIQAIQEHLDKTDETAVIIVNNKSQTTLFKKYLSGFEKRIKYSTDPTSDSLRGVRGKRFFDEFVSNRNVMKPEFTKQEGDYFSSSLPKTEEEIDVMIKVVSLYE